MKIAITGATGLVGKRLGQKLYQLGHEIYVVSRSHDKAKVELTFPYHFSGEKIPDGVEAVFHLAGENVGDSRWVKEKKKKIYDSRVRATEKLISEKPKSVRIWIQASAVGIYGDAYFDQIHRQNNVNSFVAENKSTYQEDIPREKFFENSKSFLQEVCRDWEKTTEKIDSDCRVCLARIGMVLAHQAGALEKLVLPVRMGVGSPLGGNQWSPWIHIDDLVQLFVEMLNGKNYQGIYNCVSPELIQNKEQMKQLAQLFGRPILPAIPGMMIKLLLGEMSEIVLASQKVSVQKLIDHGFRFQFTNFKDAVQKLYQHEINGEELMYCEQYVPVEKSQVFPFFADAYNLEAITPPQLNFHIKKMSTQAIQKGTLIDYRLKIHGFPARWRTLISDWRENELFVDEQLSGPYQLWHHTHEFKSFGQGTLLIDQVRYRLPMGFIGFFFANYFVRNDVKKIFQYRKDVIAKKW